MPELERLRADLRDCLLYTQDLVGFNQKVIFDLVADKLSPIHEKDLLGLEGVQVAVSPDIWLQLSRLREIRPPDPDPIFDGWLEREAHPGPHKPPKLMTRRMLRLPIEDISDLCEAGLLDADDVMRPRDAIEDHPPEMDAILLVQRMPEFQDAWQEYVDGPWKRWAETERPRRRSIEIYNQLYQVQQRVTAAGEDNAIELVWGIGIARWQHELGRINAPVIEQLVEIELLENGTLTVSPRQMPPKMALKPFIRWDIEGATGLQLDASEQLERFVDDPDRGFSPFDRRSFEPLLHMCAARLSATGLYVPDEAGYDPASRGLPAIDGTLRITDTWVLYRRQRTEDIRQADIQKLIKAVESAKTETELPPAALHLVVPPGDERLYDSDGDIDLADETWELPSQPASSGAPTGIGNWSGEPASGRREPSATTKDAAEFFPLPSNDAQREILKRLSDADGVLVQGPPGTGKTHTIANVICHYLATHRRVLVTAKTPEALKALQEKLPEGVRDLAIAVIHNDREGARQLEQAVQVLANEAKQIDTRRTSDEIRTHQDQIVKIKRRIADIDAELLDHAQRNLEKVRSRGRVVLPIELARWVTAERAQHAWFEDAMDLDPAYEPRFDEADITAARDIRTRLGEDILYPIEAIPDPDLFPPLPGILAAHRDLRRARELDANRQTGDVPIMQSGTIVQARGVHVWLQEFEEFFVAIREEAWLIPAYQMLAGAKRSDEATMPGLRRGLESWVQLYERGRELTSQAIRVGDVPLDDDQFDSAVMTYARGGRPFGLFSFGKGSLKEQLAGVTIEGRAPRVPGDWAEVRDYRIWQKDVRSFLSRWSALCRECGFESISADWARGSEDLLRLGRLIASVLKFAQGAKASIEALQLLFPYGLDAKAAIHRGELEVAMRAIAENLEQVEYLEAKEIYQRVVDLAGGRSQRFHVALTEFAGALGKPEIADQAIREAWTEIMVEAERLASRREPLERLGRAVEQVRASGAPLWAEKLATDPVLGGVDPWTPADWLESWEWRRADGFIRQLGDRDRLQSLSAERLQIDDRQRKLLAEVVKLRTFLGLKRSLTARIEAALARFASAIANLGAGTGRSAVRQRRVIRDATLDAAGAVPCWILPEWRVSEQLPAELGLFDLVIVDEASQSDITSLPALLRGKKVLIVGDDKQVSPTHVGLDERTIVQLRTTYLRNLPFADQMDPAVSLYELGGMLFPGKAILLREHFRCVEPIIRFSSRFYQNLLIPMRLPTARERLDPPLIDIFVRDGEKTGDVNLREAEVIVEEVTRLTQDPDFDGRSIGVISLIGDKQAKFIYNTLLRDLGAEVLERHRLMCGNASAFQGQERDIVFLTMVACPKTAMAQRARMYEQRYNVALSRARDRLVLVRSVSTSDLNPGDLKLATIEHFRNPMDDSSRVAMRADVLDACDSEFEREVGRRLLALGYRLRAQVPVGGFRIDFVVEGADDRRLAVECDGDSWHGPDRWAADFRRQSALERMGWRFWRCWGSSWIADADGCLADLIRTLEGMGIEPLGAEPVAGSWTEHRAVGSEAMISLNDQGELEQPEPWTIATQDQPVVPKAPAEATQHEPSAATGPVVDADEQADEALVIEPGDLVLVRYEDNPTRPIRIRLSKAENKPELGIVHVSEPLAQALLGRRLGDEIELEVGSKIRMAVIEHIERQTAVAA